MRTYEAFTELLSEQLCRLAAEAKDISRRRLLVAQLPFKLY